MTGYRETIPLGVVLRLRTDDDDDLVVDAVRLVAEDGERRLVFDVDVPTFFRIELEGLLHLTDEVRGPGAVGFRPNRSVRIEARLGGDELPAHEIADELRVGGGSPLFDADRWYALKVSTLTDEEGVRQGYRTAWDGAPVGERPLTLPMLELAAAYLEEQGWDFEDMADEPALRWELSSPAGAWTVFALAREAQDRFAVYSSPHGRVPEERRPDAAVALTKLNQGLPSGNWELNFDTGAVRFKTALDTGGERPTFALLAAVIERNLTTVDGQLPEVQPFLDG